MREGGSSSDRVEAQICTTTVDSPGCMFQRQPVIHGDCWLNAEAWYCMLSVTWQFQVPGSWRRPERPGEQCLHQHPILRRHLPRIALPCAERLSWRNSRPPSGVPGACLWLGRSAARTVRDRGLAHVQIRRCWRIFRRSADHLACWYQHPHG
jgi:hypothetical protein